jgi:hypothetical protein
VNWDALYEQYVASWAEAFAARSALASFDPPADAISCLAHPTDDVRWILGALRNPGEMPMRWFVNKLFKRSSDFSELFLEPLLDAAIDEMDPSDNRHFVDPCMENFGPRRVNEYLLAVVKSGPDLRTAGAVNALYWAQVPLVFISTESFHIKDATPQSRALYQSLQDVWDRKDVVMLETFVSNPDVWVRKSVISKLTLNPFRYPESHRPLVAQAITIARTHPNEYIRHRVEHQLRDMGGGSIAHLRRSSR